MGMFPPWGCVAGGQADRMAGKGVEATTARLDTPASREKWAAVLDVAQFTREQEIIFLNQK